MSQREPVPTTGSLGLAVVVVVAEFCGAIGGAFLSLSQNLRQLATADTETDDKDGRFDNDDDGVVADDADGKPPVDNAKHTRAKLDISPPEEDEAFSVLQWIGVAGDDLKRLFLKASRARGAKKRNQFDDVRDPNEVKDAYLRMLTYMDELGLTVPTAALEAAKVYQWTRATPKKGGAKDIVDDDDDVDDKVAPSKRARVSGATKQLDAEFVLRTAVSTPAKRDTRATTDRSDEEEEPVTQQPRTPHYKSSTPRATAARAPAEFLKSTPGTTLLTKPYWDRERTQMADNDAYTLETHDAGNEIAIFVHKEQPTYRIKFC